MCPWLDFGLSLNQSFFFAFSRWMVNGDRELLEPREDKTTSRGFDFIKYLTKQNHQSKLEKKRSRKPYIKSNDLKKTKKKINYRILHHYLKVYSFSPILSFLIERFVSNKKKHCYMSQVISLSSCILIPPQVIIIIPPMIYNK